MFGSFPTPTFGVSITVASGAPTIPVFGTYSPPAFAASSTPINRRKKSVNQPNLPSFELYKKVPVLMYVSSILFDLL